MRRPAILLLAAALVLAASGCTSLQGTGDKGFVTGDGTIHRVAAADRGQPVTLDGKTLDGRSLSLSSLRGEPTVVNVWGSWCTPCRAEAPLLVSAQKQLKGKAHFVGIDVRDSGTAQGRAFQTRFGISWPSYFSDSGEALLSFPGVLTPNTVPATVVLDRQGRISASIIGGLPSSLTLVQLVQDVVRHG